MYFSVEVTKLKCAEDNFVEIERIIGDCQNSLDAIRTGLASLRLRGIDDALDAINGELLREKQETRALLNALVMCRDVYVKNEMQLTNITDFVHNILQASENNENQNPFDFDLALLLLVHKPDGMSDEEYLDLLRTITADADKQRENGWDDKAVNAYVKQVNEAISNSEDKNYAEVLSDVYEESTKVGSDVYTKMFKASGLSDKEKADLVIEQMGGYIDDNGMLQLTGDFKFDPDMPPHADFYDALSDCVTNSYGKKGADYDDADVQKIHQLRYYIDYQNITYIREHYKGEGMTDEDALSAYVFDENGLNGDLMDAERARLHNKYPSSTTYKEYYSDKEQNRKRLTPDFHSEFIIDGDGNFVSQWNVLEWNDDGTVISDYQYYYDEYNGENASSKPYTWDEARMQVANTESFNYADKNNGVHDRVDSSIVNGNDPSYRVEMREGLSSPGKDEYKQKYEINDDFSKKR